MVEDKESRWSPGLVWPFCDQGEALVHNYKITHAGEQVAQRDFQNNATRPTAQLAHQHV